MGKSRLVSLDIFRGFLVCAMVVFHTQLHLLTLQLSEKTLLWIPVGFIGMAGFMVGNILQQYKTPANIMYRGGKLLLLFLAINIPIWWFKAAQFTTLYQQIAVPNLSYYEIIVPIGLAIVLVPWWLRVPIAGQLNLAIITLGTLDYLQYFPYVLKFTTIGLLCATVGFLFARTTYKLPAPNVLLGLSASVLVSIGIALVPTSYVLQLVLVGTLAWWVPTVLAKSTFIQNLCLTLGQYSLLLYFFHVVIIVLLALAPLYPTSNPFVFALSTFGIIGLCYVCAKAVEQLCMYSKFCKHLYAVVFK